MHVVLFHVIYCIASGAQRLIGPRENTYLADQRSRVLIVALCGTSYLAYGHLGFGERYSCVVWTPEKFNTACWRALETLAFCCQTQ